MDNSRKIKSVMMGTIDRAGRRGRPSREWLDDIRDWCHKDIHSLSIMAQNREQYKMHWTPTGSLPMDHDDDDDDETYEVDCGSLAGSWLITGWKLAGHRLAAG